MGRLFPVDLFKIAYALDDVHDIMLKVKAKVNISHAKSEHPRQLMIHVKDDI